MSDFELPDDLIDLQKRLDAALAAERAYTAEVEAARLAEAPATIENRRETPEELLERRRWTNEQQTRCNELRTETQQLVILKHEHPFMVAVRSKQEADGELMKVEKALRAAARPEPEA